MKFDSSESKEQEVNSLESSEVVRELKFAMNLALSFVKLRLPIHRRKFVLAFHLQQPYKAIHLNGYLLQTSHQWMSLRKPLYR